MRVSVIIPAFNEATEIANTIQAVRQRGKALEIIAVDGGSTDGTLIRAKEAGASGISSPRKGRAAQMNYGAQFAKGEILYFLHADSIPPDNFTDVIEDAVCAGGKDSGCFRLAFDEDHFLLNSYAWFTRFDLDAFRFGDQSLFVTKSAFNNLGGFREDHIVMEDNEIVRRIKKDYSFVVLDGQVETSARAYLGVGVLKLQLIFTLIFILYFLGVSQETLGHIRKKMVS